MSRGRLILNTEVWAGSVLGGLLRAKKQVSARFQLLAAQSDSGDGAAVSPFGLPTVLRFARFRVIVI